MSWRFSLWFIRQQHQNDFYFFLNNFTIGWTERSPFRCLIESVIVCCLLLLLLILFTQELCFDATDRQTKSSSSPLFTSDWRWALRLEREERVLIQSNWEETRWKDLEALLISTWCNVIIIGKREQLAIINKDRIMITFIFLYKYAHPGSSERAAQN